VDKCEKIPYVVCSGGRFVFRRRIPEDVRSLFLGKTERHIAINATDPSDIERIALQHKRAFDREVEAARRQLAAASERAVREDDIPTIAKFYEASVLDTDEWERDEGYYIKQHREAEQMAHDALASRRAAVARGDYGSASDLLEAILPAVRLREPTDPQLLRTLQKALLQAEIRSLEAQLARLRGEEVPTPEAPNLQGHYVGQGVLGEDGYFDKMYALWKKRAQPSVPTLYEAELTLRRLAKFMGADESAFRSTLLTADKALEGSEGKPRLHLREVPRAKAVEFKDYLLDEEEILPQTARKGLGLVHSLVQYSVHQKPPADGSLIPNPFHGLWTKQELKKLRGRKPRVALEVEHLNAVFRSPLYVGGPDPEDPIAEAVYWIYPLEQFTGARLEELAQLELSDVRFIQSHWWLRFERDEREKRGKRGAKAAAPSATEGGKWLKTSSSERIVPVHEELVRIGFLAYVEALRKQGALRVFPQLTRNSKGRLSANLSKRGNRLLDRLGIADKRLVLYSTRHGFKHFCRESGVPLEVHDSLTGHASRNAGGGYGGDYFPLKRLVDGIKMFRIPGLDLSHLYRRAKERYGEQLLPPDPSTARKAALAVRATE